jgi:hypothetical protein
LAALTTRAIEKIPKLTVRVRFPSPAPPRKALQRNRIDKGAPLPRHRLSCLRCSGVRDDVGGQCADPRLVGAVRGSPTRAAAAWCGEVPVQEHGGVAGRTPCGPVGRGVPGVARRLEQPPDVQGVVVAESAGIRVGLPDQGGPDIRKGDADVNLGGPRRGRAADAGRPGVRVSRRRRGRRAAGWTSGAPGKTGRGRR